MNATRDNLTGELSRQARARLPRALFYADWLDVTFLHYEVEPAALRPWVPFELDLREGRAYVSLVEFTIRRMRIASLGRAGEWLMRPMSDHWFLNARTYVRAGGASGIYFLAEWLS